MSCQLLCSPLSRRDHTATRACVLGAVCLSMRAHTQHTHTHTHTHTHQYCIARLMTAVSKRARTAAGTHGHSYRPPSPGRECATGRTESLVPTPCARASCFRTSPAAHPSRHKPVPPLRQLSFNRISTPTPHTFFVANRKSRLALATGDETASRLATHSGIASNRCIINTTVCVAHRFMGLPRLARQARVTSEDRETRILQTKPLSWS